MVLPTPGGPESRAALAQAPLSWACAHGAGLGADFPCLKQYKKRSKEKNFFLQYIHCQWHTLFQLTYWVGRTSIKSPGPNEISSSVINTKANLEKYFRFNYVPMKMIIIPISEPNLKLVHTWSFTLTNKKECQKYDKLAGSD